MRTFIASILALVTLAGSLATSSAQAGVFANPAAVSAATADAGATVQDVKWMGGGHMGWGAAGLLGGLAAGAIIAGAASAQPVYCGPVRQRVYDEYGRFIGYRTVSTC